MRQFSHYWSVFIVLSLMIGIGPVLAQDASVEFLWLDIETQGNWQGAYGEDGYNIIEDTEAYPSYVELTATDNAAWTWVASTDDVRALEKGGGGDRIAACWFNNGTSTIDVNLVDGRAHEVALYLIDWDSTIRVQTVEVQDAQTGEVLDSHDIESFGDGLYLVWKIKGHVAIKVIHTGGANAVISGLFFDKSTTKGASQTPVPIDTAVDVPRDTVLSWTSGPFAAKHNLYLGDSFDDVNDATVPTAAGLDVNSFDPGRFEFGKTYYWRVDEVNNAPDNTVYKGEVWSFEAEPYSIPVLGAEIIVTASSSSNESSLPERTLDGSGMGDNDTHGIATETMWFTAMDDMNPWIQYEFDAIKKLDTMRVWNSNSAAEGFIGYGVKGVSIEYSQDGETWTVFEDVNEFSRAVGLPTYDQYDEIAFNGVAARMVRLNIQSNFGGFLKSYSLSEVQFKAIPTAARTPVPVTGSVGVLPNDVLSWRAGRETAQSTIYLSTDPNEVADAVAPSATSNIDSLNLSTFDLQMGETYYWRVDEVNNAEAVPVWAGPVWSLTVVDAVVVDDFESYTNDSPDRPFQTWLDGFGYSADEFFSVGYAGNGSGAGIGHDIWSVASPYYNGQIMEETIVKRGNLSLPFYYNNTGGVASLTERTFTVPQDWTAGGSKTLSLLFRGQADNTGTLHVKINDVKVTYPREAANIAKPVWQAFNIDLAGVNTNLSSVTKLSIGVAGANASGMLLIDDIALYPEGGEVVTPIDPGSANLVGFWDFDAGSGTIVADSSGHGNAGTVEGGGQANAWVPGQKGTAISTSANAYVNVPAAAWSSVDTQFTVSFWAKGDAALDNNWTFFAGNAGRIVSGHLPWNGQVIFDTTEAWDTERIVVDAAEDELRGLWRHWTFVRNAETGEKQIYLDGALYGSTMASADPIAGIDRFFIGSGDAGGTPYVGLIDEFQLYDRALSAGEILWLAGGTVPIDKPF